MDESCPYRTVPPTRTQVPLAGSTNHEMNCKSDGVLVTGSWSGTLLTLLTSSITVSSSLELAEKGYLLLDRVLAKVLFVSPSLTHATR